MTKYLLIDTQNMLHRAKHVTNGDMWTRVGLAMHVMLASINKCWHKFDADHVIFCLEGKSWRKAVYEPYKRNRAAATQAKSAEEQDDDNYFFSSTNELIKFLDERTNCTVLRSPICEADDLIARWIQTHPDDEHIIVSSDTDFIQLLAANVSMYDGIRDHHICHDRILNKKDQPLSFSIKSDGKLKLGDPDVFFKPEPDWVEWSLFVKAIRGDKSDNVFTAYPGARLAKMKKVFEDREAQGYEWNNFMLYRWTDHNDQEFRVRDAYERNLMLIDLTRQPDKIKLEMDTVISEAISRKNNAQVGTHFLRFAGKYELVKISENPQPFVEWLAASYPE